MVFLDESAWRGKVYSGGWRPAAGGRRANTLFGGIFASGTGARFGGSANLDAFTDTRWVTMRREIAPYPF